MRWLHQLHDCHLPPWEVSARFVSKGFPLQKLFWFIHVYLKLIQCYPFLKLLNRGISLTGSVYRSSLSLLRSGIMLATFLLFGTKRYIFSYFNQQLYIPVTGLATVAITKLGSVFQYLIFFGYSSFCLWFILLLHSWDRPWKFPKVGLQCLQGLERKNRSSKETPILCAFSRLSLCTCILF